MKLHAYRNLWGVAEPWPRAVPRLLDSGYEGIEAVLFTRGQAAAMKRLLRGRRFPFKGTIWTRNAGGSPRAHLADFRHQLEVLTDVGASSVNVMGGSDLWSESDAKRYFEGALKIGERAGIPISHETHRATALFHPAPAAGILRAFPELRLTCDFSHWVVASERLIHDSLDLIRLCAERADHVHVRVGNEQSPQVPDVRSPEARPYLRVFEAWWDLIWAAQRRRGATVSTFCPEFGPPPYMPVLPFSGKPLSDLEAVCDWQRDRQRKRFARQRHRA